MQRKIFNSPIGIPWNIMEFCGNHGWTVLDKTFNFRDTQTRSIMNLVVRATNNE